MTRTGREGDALGFDDDFADYYDDAPPAATCLPARTDSVAGLPVRRPSTAPPGATALDSAAAIAPPPPLTPPSPRAHPLPHRRRTNRRQRPTRTRRFSASFRGRPPCHPDRAPAPPRALRQRPQRHRAARRPGNGGVSRSAPPTGRPTRIARPSLSSRLPKSPVISRSPIPWSQRGIGCPRSAGRSGPTSTARR